MKNKFLILILALAFFLRVWGISYGLPNFFVGDEQSIVGGALRMAELKTLVPAFHPDEFSLLYYPPLASYLYLVWLAPFLLVKYIIGGFSNFSDFKDWLIINPGLIWLAARLLVVFLGTASVYLMYLAGKKIFSHRAGLLAALFLATSFFQVQLSHFARHWLPACFFTLLLIILAFELWQKGQRKYFILSGIVAGLAFGISYVTAIAFLLPLFSYFFLAKGKFSQKIKNKNFWLMIGLFCLIALIFVALWPQEFIKITLGEDSTAKAAKSFSGFLSSFYYYFLNLVYFEPVVLLFSFLGAILLFLRDKKRLAFLLFYPFIYISLFYLFLHQEVRYTLLILPFLALLAVYFVDLFAQKFFAKNFLFTFLLIIIFILPLGFNLRYDWLLSQKDTRILVGDWLRQNVAEGTKIIADVRDLKITPTKDALRYQEALDSNSLRTIDRTLLNLADEKYPRPAYDVLDLHYLNKVLPENLVSYAKKNDYQYFIISYWQKIEISQEEEKLISQAELITKFTPTSNMKTYDFNGNYQGPAWVLFQMVNLGPIVEIYKL